LTGEEEDPEGIDFGPDIAINGGEEPATPDPRHEHTSPAPPATTDMGSTRSGLRRLQHPDDCLGVKHCISILNHEHEHQLHF
jgi:hypothetical protein